MKKLILFCFIFIVPLALIGQKSNSSFLNEFTLSANKSDVKEEGRVNRFGLGIGFFHFYEGSKYANVLSGFEFNRGSYFKNYEYVSHGSSYKNLTYTYYDFNLRFMPRILLGNSLKLFFDFGPELDIPILCYKEGVYSYLDSNTSQIVSITKKEKCLSQPVFYISFGIGIMKSFKKLSFWMKPEYKYGMTERSDKEKINQRYFDFAIGIRFNKQ